MNRTRLKVLGLSYSMSQTGAYALILADEQDKYRIPIVIGMPEAQSIAIELEKIQTQRPLTHDLMKKLADELDAVLEEVYIYRVEMGIFYAELLYVTDKRVIKIDSRTSDAIALALRYGCPIYSSTEVIEKIGIRVTPEGDRQDAPTTIMYTTTDSEAEMEEYSVEELRQMLKEAVEKEEYEKASRIRDILKLRQNKEE